MDEELRDTYNRFGPAHLEFDPRKDEMKLIADISVSYIFLGILTYVMTIPTSSRGCRTWIIILGVAFLALEVSFSLTELTIPAQIPELLKSLTEYELLYYMTSAFPLLIGLLCILSKYYYVDLEQTTIAVLHDVLISQKVCFLPSF
jgi:hypothetical protein